MNVRRSMSRPMRSRLATLALAALALGLAAAPAEAEERKKQRELREMLFVGNNWDGTVDVLRSQGNYRRIARINAIPDIKQRMSEIYRNPVRLGYFLAIRALIGEGHDQYVDDMYTTNDGRLLIISRPSFADVVALNVDTGKLAWRFVVDGQRSDHMAISPDGKRVSVSASTGNVVHVLDTESGREVGRFPSGDSPHENVYSADGERIYHASIGLVYTPADRPITDTTKGDRYFQIVDAKTNEVIKRLDMGEELAEAGYPNLSSAVRPMAIGPKETFAYFQVSFLHGFVEYNLKKEKVRRVARLRSRRRRRRFPASNTCSTPLTTASR